VSSPVSWMYFECTLSHVIGTDVPPHAYHLFSLLRLRQCTLVLQNFVTQYGLSAK
jgi:hypothetical protein